ncbi:hypothetical protein [Anaerotignum sp.]|uniref:hypothetical protein n=1 Tax=Anaerotignum sp. TaxID=2039241 RepID=UPI002A917019|nr:hypothetical protein [Anaerotignum sp.]MCI7657757.1 hypothetical protein [Clostridia bacterium]MDY5414734.1 hypothetical protein [Anaerotignum sp.]
MKKYGVLAALVMAFALTGCGGEKQTEVAAQEAMADTMINSGRETSDGGFERTYPLDNTQGEALHFYVTNEREPSDVYTELVVTISCGKKEVAREVILPGESTVVTTMLTEKEKEYTCKAEPGKNGGDMALCYAIVQGEAETEEPAAFLDEIVGEPE